MTGQTAGFATRAIHVGQPPDALSGAVNVPLYLSSTYAQEEIGGEPKYDYSRAGNPTRTALEGCLASLEGAKHGIAFGSGCAATTAVLLTLKSGDRLSFSYLFLFLGALPCTEWLDDAVARDAKGFILTGDEAGADNLLDTSVPGVLAAGDVRSGSTKRCAAPVSRHVRSARMTTGNSSPLAECTVIMRTPSVPSSTTLASAPSPLCASVSSRSTKPRNEMPLRAS